MKNLIVLIPLFFTVSLNASLNPGLAAAATDPHSLDEGCEACRTCITDTSACLTTLCNAMASCLGSKQEEPSEQDHEKQSLVTEPKAKAKNSEDTES